eukprot:5279533-Pleurochrysis_carterae.AAC.6
MSMSDQDGRKCAQHVQLIGQRRALAMSARTRPRKKILQPRPYVYLGGIPNRFRCDGIGVVRLAYERTCPDQGRARKAAAGDGAAR